MPRRSLCATLSDKRYFLPTSINYVPQGYLSQKSSLQTQQRTRRQSHLPQLPAGKENAICVQIKSRILFHLREMQQALDKNN